MDELRTALDALGTANGLVQNVLSVWAKLSSLGKSGDLPPDLAGEVASVSVDAANAQVQIANAQTELATMKRALAERDSLEKWKRKYALAETSSGACVYRLKKTPKSSEPDHGLCPACFENDKRGILQPLFPGLKCPVCSMVYKGTLV